MRILIAPDSFKGSMTAQQAAFAMERGVLLAIPDATVMKQPVSDGGEGLVDVVTPALGGRIVSSMVSGPLPGQRITARWGLSADGSTAIIEMAEAAGLPHVPRELRNPNITTTAGVGELIKAALDAGVTSIVIGIGGSATNDGGAGMAEALGVQFLDSAGKPIGRGGAELVNLTRIDLEQKDERLDNVEVLVACDVQNTLCGREGASAVYGPQKGATLSDVSVLDKALEHFGRTIESQMNIDVLSLPGGGAAGGLGAGLVAFCGGTLLSGIDLILRVTKFEERLRESDLVITGEGKIDRQLQYGKALSGVIERARKFTVPVVAVVGRIEGERELFVNSNALADLESLMDGQTTEADAMSNASHQVSEKTKLLLQRYLSRT
ncbi:MAG: glycerate kinase [Ignavibacteriales bacterium]|nr:glycerate kinase [Ignavibacteriales bacterium]